MSQHKHIARAALSAITVAVAVAACGGSSHQKTATATSKQASVSTPASTTSSSSSAEGKARPAAKAAKAGPSGKPAKAAKDHVSTATTPASVVTKNHKRARLVGTASTIPLNVPQNLKARADVVMNVCASAPGGHRAGGTIKNTLGKSADYKITVIFTDAKATAIGYGVTTVSVNAGKAAAWNLSGTFKHPAKVECVLRGVDT